MQNHELVSQTVVEKDGALSAVHTLKLQGGVTLSSAQPVAARDENLLAVAKKFGVQDITRQMAARKLLWKDALPQEAPKPSPVVAVDEPKLDAQASKPMPEAAKGRVFGR